MGILNKLVHILAKLDPENELWKQAQLKVVDDVPDPIIKQKLKEQITVRFAEKNANYGRKLYLIEKCIYGVDIQQIAIEIAKLRFFIALLVDEKVDKSKGNWGVEPLPNLEFKLMQGNSLVSEFKGINLDADNSQSYGKLMKDELDVLIDEFQSRKSDFQSETDPKKKSQLKKTVENLIIKIFESKLKEQKAGYLNQFKSIENKYSHFNNDAQKNQLITKEVEELNRKSGFDLKAAEKQLRDFTTGFVAKPFFAWKLYFAEVFQGKGGFDIVIANPPYGVKFTEHEKELFLRTYFHQDYQLDSYLLFLEKAFVFLCQDGVLTFIIPNPWLTNLKTKKIRRYVFSNHTIQEINHYSRKVFDAVVDTEVVVILKRPPVSNSVSIRTISSPVESTTNIVPQHRWREMDGEPVNIFLDDKQELLARKIRGSYDQLGNICKIAAGVKPYEVGKGSPPQTQEMVNKRVYDATFQKDKTYSPILRGRDIEKYLIKWDGKRWIKYGENLAAPRKLENFIAKGKIVIRQTGDSLVAAFDTSQFICMNNMHTINSNDSKYDLIFLLGLINSSLLTYYFQCLNPEKGEALAEVKKENVEKLPVASASTDQQKPIIQLVQKLITAKKQDPEADSTVLEHQIDQMVYELYGLTPEEIAVVEGKAK